MKVVLTSTCLLVLLCGCTFGTRIELFQTKGEDGMAGIVAAAPSDGICETMVKPHGYACEEHQVTTRDSYILSVQRIPLGQSGGTAKGRSPVLLQHGLLADGSSWLVLPPDQALAFVLADSGFDVWISNSRGTTYSLGLSFLSPQDKVYWNWSWDELVSDELPALFQYVYNETGLKMQYVGHSQGSLIALAALSKQHLVNVWKSAALLAPISSLDHICSNLVRLAADKMLANVSYWLGLAKFDLLGVPEIELLVEICGTPGINCSNVMSAFSGEDCCLNTSVVFSREPEPSATKNMIHFAQMIKAGTIAMYDYQDENTNKEHYGQPTPSAYKMASIPDDFPLFLSHGGADSLSDVKDVSLLIDSLKDHVPDKLEVQFIDKYAHIDFVIGVNAKEVV